MLLLDVTFAAGGASPTGTRLPSRPRCPSQAVAWRGACRCQLCERRINVVKHVFQVALEWEGTNAERAFSADPLNRRG